VNPAYYSLIFLWLVIFLANRKRKRSLAIRKILKRRKKEGNKEMKALAERFIGKECVIYSFDGGHQFTGVIKEVADGAVLVEKEGSVEALNLDFVIRIREYPKNKNGKKKSVILD